MCFVGNLLGFPAVKIFENPLGIDKAIAMSMVYYFFGTPCSCHVSFSFQENSP